MPTPKHIKASVVGPGYWAIFTIRCLNIKSDKDKKEAINMISNDLLSFPCVDPCRKHALKYLAEHPFEDDMVKWITEFHNFVNRRLEKKEYNRKDVEEEWKPKVCSLERNRTLFPGYWAAIHIRALNATTDIQKHYASRHICLDLIRYPCSQYQHTLKEYIKSHPVKECIRGEECSLFKWTVDLHNHINRIREKEEISYIEAKTLWDPEGFCDNCDNP
jgi:hypothetical protein